MISLQNIFSIFKREIRSYINNPSTYIFVGIFLLLWEFLFFRNFFIVEEVSLQSLFDWLPWLFMVLVPALMMGSIAQEQGEGTIELLLTHPVRELEVLLGKYLAGMAVIAAILVAVVPLGLGVDLFGRLDWGTVVAQVLAALMMASVFVSLGLFVSSLFRGQIAVLLVNVVINFFLILAGNEFISSALPIWLNPLLSRLSVLTHFAATSRGVLDLKDIWYAVTASAVFFCLAYLQLVKPKLKSLPALYRKYQTGIALVIAIAVFSNSLGSHIPGRLDLTSTDKYTLSATTKEILAGLPDLTVITVYNSAQLPAKLQPVLRDVKDTLRDYVANSKGKLTVKYIDPASDPKLIEQAEKEGVQRVQFNVVGQGQLSVTEGYLGLVVRHAGLREPLHFIQDSSDFEYQLTTLIHRLRNNKRPRLAFLSGHGEKSRTSDFKILNEELQRFFDVTDFTFDAKKPEVSKDYAALVIPGPNSKITTGEKEAIDKYFKEGGAVMVLVDKFNIEADALLARSNDNNFSEFVAPYGVVVNSDLAYDLKAAKRVSLQKGGFSVNIDYPFWVKAKPSSESRIVARLPHVSLSWPSSLSIDEKKVEEKGLEAVRLLTTTDSGGVIASVGGSVSVNPEQKFNDKDLSAKVLAVSLQPKSSDNAKKTGGRLIVIGTTNIFNQQYLSGAPENIVFGLEAASWLTQELSLASIKLKQESGRDLAIVKAYHVPLVRYGNIALAVLAPALYGALHLWRRRAKSGLVYA